MRARLGEAGESSSSGGAADALGAGALGAAAAFGAAPALGAAALEGAGGTATGLLGWDGSMAEGAVGEHGDR